MNGIQLTKLSWPFLFPSFAIFFSFAEKTIKLNTKWKPHFIIYQIYIYFSITIVGSLECVYLNKEIQSNIRSSIRNNIINHSHSHLRLSLPNDNRKRIQKVPLILLITMSIFYTSNQFLLNLFYDHSNLNDSNKLGLMLFQSILSAFLSYWLFKTVYHIQHYVSLFIVICSYTCIALNSLSKLKDQWIFITVALALYQMQIAIEICEKYLMENKYFTPLRLIFIKGISSLCSLIVFLAFAQAFECKDHIEDYFSCERDGPIEAFLSLIFIFKGYNASEVVLFVSFIFTETFYFVFSIFTNYHYSTSHKALVDIVAYFPYWMLRFKDNGESFKEILTITFSYILIILACCIYSEIIVLNFCNYKENKAWKEIPSEDAEESKKKIKAFN